MGTLNSWDIVDANNNATPPDGWPENTMQYSEVNNTGRAVQGTLKRYFADVNGSLVAGGVADAYTVSLNETGYTTYFTGMYFSCQINADNTGASTMNVNGIGVQNIINRDGTALEAGALQSGGIYEFRYDGTDFQVMGSIAGASVTVSEATFTNSNDPDLVDTDVAINVGAADPDTAQHIEIGPSDIQSKSDSTTAAELALNELGGNLRLGPQSGSGNVYLYDTGELKLQTTNIGVSVNGDVASSSPPVEADTPNTIVELYDLNRVTRLGYVGYPTLSSLVIDNEIHGGLLALRGENTGGTLQNCLVADPDGSVELYYQNANKVETSPVSAIFRGNAASSTPPVLADAVDTYIQLYDTGSNRLSYIGHSGNGVLQIVNEMHGGDIQLNGEDNGGVARALAFLDPDGAASLYYQGTQVTSTLPAASGGLQANNTLTGAGFERVLTTSDLGSVGLQITFLPARVNGYGTVTPTGNGGTTGWQLFDMSVIYPAGVGEDYAIVWCKVTSNDATPPSNCTIHLRPVGSTANTILTNEICNAAQGAGEPANQARQNSTIYFIELDANGDFEYYNLVNGPTNPGAGRWDLQLIGFISL